MILNYFPMTAYAEELERHGFTKLTPAHHCYRYRDTTFPANLYIHKYGKHTFNYVVTHFPGKGYSSLCLFNNVCSLQPDKALDILRRSGSTGEVEARWAVAYNSLFPGFVRVG